MQTNKKLYDDGLITEKQFLFLESIRTEKVISVFYEIKFLLYAGITLFTGGLGYLAYENMSQFGHVLLMFLMAAAAIYGFYFVIKKALPYSNEKIPATTPYFDYAVLLVALLLVGLFTYVQVYFNLIEVFINYSSLLTAIMFFFMAYRFDNKILLSMAITAMAATFGLTFTPIGWLKAEWFETSDLYSIAIILGLILISGGIFLSQKSIKPHFLFSYQHYGLLFLYAGFITAIFIHEIWVSVIVIAATSVVLVYTWKSKKFLFFLYSVLTAYTAITYLIFEGLIAMSESGFILMIYYFPISCIAAIVFFITQKAHFKNDE